MDIKRIAKNLIAPVKCTLTGVEHNTNLYIGKGCKIVGGRNIHVGENVSIMPYTMLHCPKDSSQIVLGDHVEIGMFSRIAADVSVTLADNVFSGPHIFIADFNHEYRDPDIPIRLQGDFVRETEEMPRGGVVVGADTWLGTNVVIAGTVRIGRHCVIGANSVVTRDVPDYSVAVGSPARVIRTYDPKAGRWVRCE